MSSDHSPPFFPATRAMDAAYRATSYVVLGCGAMRIGHRADRLARRGATFVTAHNPLGHPMTRAFNIRCARRLQAALRRRGWRFIHAEGRPDDPSVPPEPGLLVFGTSRGEAAALGRMVRQNAVVHVRRGKRAELVALR